MTQQHGGRAQVTVNGAIIGDMQNFEVTRNYAQEKKKPLGSLAATEIIITDYEVEFSGEHYRVSGQSLIALGFEPGNLDPQDILDLPGVQIVVRDVRTGEVLERLRGAKISQSSRGYAKGQLTMERISGSALIATDETEN